MYMFWKLSLFSLLIWKEFKNLQQKLVVAHYTLFLIPGSFLGPISEETPCLCPECLPPLPPLIDTPALVGKLALVRPPSFL